MNRTRQLNNCNIAKGSFVLYWMRRDMRITDNHALYFAQDIARKQNAHLVVVFTLAQNFLNATLRHYDFLFAGLKKLEQELLARKIPLCVLFGNPVSTLRNFIERHALCALVCDFSPLRPHRIWTDELCAKITVPVFEIDAHNIVPVWIASNKREFAARTIRPKINALLQHFLYDMPPDVSFYGNRTLPFEFENNWIFFGNNINCDRKISAITSIISGEDEAKITLTNFLEQKLEQYAKYHNDPNAECTSKLSPYLHFGQISAQRIALEVLASETNSASIETFIEQLIIRRELAENFCCFEKNYDTYAGFPAWAQETLEKHAHDTREYVYEYHDFECGKTHDALWNACQNYLIKTGALHGYVRMYWAKKLLEWTADPKDALTIANYLNDKYALDGRDANGYVGNAWCIGGLHDRPWFERNIFGTIRYMNYSGCVRKFDVPLFIEKSALL